MELANRNVASLWRHFDPQIWWRQGGGCWWTVHVRVYAWTGRWWRLHVGKNYGWARIAQLPAADAPTCRQCLVHLIRGGGMLMSGDLILNNVLCQQETCWLFLFDMSALAPILYFSVKYIFAWLDTCNCGCLQSIFIVGGLEQIQWHTHVQSIFAIVKLEKCQMSILHLDFPASEQARKLGRCDSYLQKLTDRGSC